MHRFRPQSCRRVPLDSPPRSLARKSRTDKILSSGRATFLRAWVLFPPNQRPVDAFSPPPPRALFPPLLRPTRRTIITRFLVSRTRRLKRISKPPTSPNRNCITRTTTRARRPRLTITSSKSSRPTRPLARGVTEANTMSIWKTCCERYGMKLLLRKTKSMIS